MPNIVNLLSLSHPSSPPCRKRRGRRLRSKQLFLCLERFFGFYETLKAKTLEDGLPVMRGVEGACVDAQCLAEVAWVVVRPLKLSERLSITAAEGACRPRGLVGNFKHRGPLNSREKRH